MKVVYGIAAFFLAGSVIIYAVHPSPGLTDMLAVATALLGFAASVYTWSRLRERKGESTVWALLSLGLLLWLGGETLWLYLESTLQEVPFPSVADVSWLLAYPVLFAALFLEYKRLDVDLGRARKTSIQALILVATVIMIWALLYSIAVSDEISVTEKFLDLVYPIGDLALLYVALLLSCVYLGGRLGRSWILISVGFILFSFGDLAFSYLTWEELYWSGHPVDLLWLFGDIFVFVGCSLYRHAYERLG
ncbi:MAG: hypothetical protein HXS41_02565 [Theionarchaea archaeon]|nr:hypothetical protein [Theionarchaea archaeon]MBU7001137.1 hypothetical protein [Theionarchaea archaeon]MBU7019916.1 hypothetical protein [Theionarchaea archaeon]MBU7035385.1 hypothetical protein [Theionarchaea archaeon]MBU7039543.1 hypothetical protein [Theionarchaea archaeon]